uniref:Large ribosomal subunit protein mL64 n=1 Tax=Panagrellus redivivus TaxID=6233 RepID=A0A7E4VHA3_PANRE
MLNPTRTLIASVLPRPASIRTRATTTAPESSTAAIPEDPVAPPTRPIETRLNERHRIIAEGGVPPVTYDFEKAKWAMRQRFGEYGLASGVDIAKLWPTVEEVEEQKALKFYRKYSDAAEIALKAESEKAAAVKAKLAEIRKNEATYEKKLAEYYNSQVKAEAEKSEQDKVMERRIREIQEYFGYWIDPKDPRFDVMLKQKEAEEKKAEKLAKRLAAEQKKIAATV